MIWHILRVKGLRTKTKYRFRVLAENLAGPGKASSETDPVLIKDPIGISYFLIAYISFVALMEQWWNNHINAIIHHTP